MDLNLALAIVAAEAADGVAERGTSPYFWPMAELIGFIISECDPALDTGFDPAVEAILAEPDRARELAAEIDRQVAASKSRAQAHQEEWMRLNCPPPTA